MVTPVFRMIKRVLGGRSIAGKSRRGLKIEKLESRSLMAVARFFFRLLHDDHGTPGAVIESNTVSAGESFFADLRVREFHPYIYGVTAASLDIKWDPALFEFLDEERLRQVDTPIITDDFPRDRNGSLVKEIGEIQGLSAHALVGFGFGRALGDLEDDRFALLRFRSLGNTGAASLSLSHGEYDVILENGAPVPPSRVDYEELTVQVVAAFIPNELQSQGLDTTDLAHANDTIKQPVSVFSTGSTIRPMSLVGGVRTTERSSIANRSALELNGVCLPRNAQADRPGSDAPISTTTSALSDRVSLAEGEFTIPAEDEANASLSVASSIEMVDLGLDGNAGLGSIIDQVNDFAMRSRGRFDKDEVTSSFPTWDDNISGTETIVSPSKRLIDNRLIGLTFVNIVDALKRAACRDGFDGYIKRVDVLMAGNLDDQSV